MKKLVLAAFLLVLAAPAAQAETQANANKRVLDILQTQAHISSKDVTYLAQQLKYPLLYDTAAHLLADAPTEGALAYAQDTNVFYMRSGASWVAVADTADASVVATEAALLASSPADGTIAFATDTTTFWLRSNGAWSVGLSPTVLTLGNGATISNATNNSIKLSENNETLSLDFTSNTCTLTSSTGLNAFSFGTIAPTMPSATINGVVTMTNGGTISNETNNAFIFAENSEDLKFAFTSNTCTLSSSTGVDTLALGAIGMTGSGSWTNSATGSIGWSAVAGANTACNTTCTYACVIGLDAGTHAFVPCDDATADTCLCAGAN